MRQATAEIKQAEAAALRAQADLERTKSQYERFTRISRSVVDKEQLDETRLGFEAAQAAVAKAQADIDVAKAKLEVAKADRDRVQTLLRYTKIEAPFDGVVTGRNVNTGDFVQPAAKSEALFVVERIEPVRVFINVPEMDAVWIRDGDQVAIRVQSLRGQEFPGTVTRTSKSLHPQNRTLRTEIDLPNKDRRLLPGMFVNATITVEHKDVWALPEKAIVTQGEQTFCSMMENGKPVRTPIQVGLRGGEWVEVMKKQTKPGEWKDFTGAEKIVENAAMGTR